MKKSILTMIFAIILMALPIFVFAGTDEYTTKEVTDNFELKVERGTPWESLSLEDYLVVSVKAKTDDASFSVINFDYNYEGTGIDTINFVEENGFNRNGGAGTVGVSEGFHIRKDEAVTLAKDEEKVIGYIALNHTSAIADGVPGEFTSVSLFDNYVYHREIKSSAVLDSIKKNIGNETYNIDLIYGDMKFTYNMDDETWEAKNSKSSMIKITNNCEIEDLSISFDWIPNIYGVSAEISGDSLYDCPLDPERPCTGTSYIYSFGKNETSYLGPKGTIDAGLNLNGGEPNQVYNYYISQDTAYIGDLSIIIEVSNN